MTEGRGYWPDKENTLQPHQERVVVEKRELDDKLTKLRAFFKAATFTTLPEEEQLRLERQSRLMQEYSDVLGERIAAF
jgi:hypothetical protein